MPRWQPPDDWYIESTGESLILDQEKALVEIERLKAENDVLHKTDKWRYETVLQLKAEIERLRQQNCELRRWKSMDKPITAAMAVVNGDVQALRAEIERLRAALKNARDALHNDFEPDNQSRAWHRANAALEQERAAEV